MFFDIYEDDYAILHEILHEMLSYMQVKSCGGAKTS